MDIYRHLKITGMKVGVKNPERVNVYVNGEFEFSLDVAQIVELGVKVGKVISAEELERFKKESEFGKLYQRTLEWVMVRPRSERETLDYLRRKLKNSSSDALVSARRYGRDCARALPVGRAWSSDEIFEFSEKIIDALTSKGYVDDEKFARWWVENRFIRKGVSRKRLATELLAKGMTKEIIDEVLDARDDTAEIRKIIEKKRGKYTDEKLIAYLCRQGFSYDLVREMVERADDF